MIIELSINGMLALKKLWSDARRQDWLVEKFGLRRLQRFDDAIQGEPPFLLLTRSRRQKEALLAGCK